MHRPEMKLVFQFLRYGIAGAGAVMIYSAVYLLFAGLVFAKGYAVFAVAPAFLLSLAASFLLHSRWTFRAHGTRDGGVGQPLRFTLVQAGGFALNSLFTYIVTVPLGGANWLALIPCVLITPVATFAAQRVWVFA